MKNFQWIRITFLAFVLLAITGCRKEYTCICQDSGGFATAKKLKQHHKEDATVLCDRNELEHTFHIYDPSASIDTTITATRDCWILE